MASYLGSKAGAGVYQAIIALMPPHDTYVEAFAGSAAVFKRKPAAAHSMLIDVDPQAPCFAGAGQVDPLGPQAPALMPGVDALWWLEYLANARARYLHGRALIYCDPPYLHSERSSRKRYRHEFTEAEHERLAAALGRLADAGVAVIVSGYPSALYDRLYAGWNTREFQAMTHGGVRTEKLWFNFEPGSAHWSTFAGENRTERQRIKRKAARWAAGWAKLPPAERQAVLAAILEAAGERRPQLNPTTVAGVDASDCATRSAPPPATVDGFDCASSSYAPGPVSSSVDGFDCGRSPPGRLDDVATEPETALSLRASSRDPAQLDPTAPDSWPCVLD